MIYKKIKNETGTELKEISFEEAVKLAGTGFLEFDSQIEEMNFYKEVVKMYPTAPSNSLEKPKTSKLTSLYQYLEEEEIHEIIVKYFENAEDSPYHDLNIYEIFPFASEEDCDFIFQKLLENKREDVDMINIAPFVSENCLSHFVDAYVEGLYVDTDIDSLYPFLASKDIKRLLEYYLSKKNSSKE